MRRVAILVAVWAMVACSGNQGDGFDVGVNDVVAPIESGEAATDGPRDAALDASADTPADAAPLDTVVTDAPTDAASDSPMDSTRDAATDAAIDSALDARSDAPTDATPDRLLGDAGYPCPLDVTPTLACSDIIADYDLARTSALAQTCTGTGLGTCTVPLCQNLCCNCEDYAPPSSASTCAQRLATAYMVAGCTMVCPATTCTTLAIACSSSSGLCVTTH
jgi:hypothetical protein